MLKNYMRFLLNVVKIQHYWIMFNNIYNYDLDFLKSEVNVSG